MLLLASLAVTAAVLVWFYRLRAGPGYPLDDSWIHLAFARHLAEGAGFGVNPDQLSSGSTSPLWALCLSLGFLLGADHRIWPWLLAALLLAGAGLAGARVVRHLLAASGGAGEASRRPIFELLGGSIVVCAPVAVWSSAGAMELPLFVALLLWAWAAQIRERSAVQEPGTAGRSSAWLPGSLWGLPAGLAALARPEGLLFALLLAVCSHWRSALRNLGITALIYAPYAVFCLLVSGQPFPSTLYAKTTHALAGLPDLNYLAQSASLLARLTPAMAGIFAIGLLAWLLARRPGAIPVAKDDPAGVRRWRWASLRRALPGLLFLGALPAAYASMGRTFLFAGLAGNFGRYLYPLASFLGLLGIWGIGTVAPASGLWARGEERDRGAQLAPRAATSGRERSRARSARPPAASATLLRWCALGVGAGALIGNLATTLHRAPFYARNVRDINALQVEMAQRLKQALPSGSKVAANDVGALAYFTDLWVLDLVGIVSPEVQRRLFPVRAQSRRVRHEALLQVLVEERAAAIVVFPLWYREILATLQPALVPITEIHVADNITAAQGNLVAYRIHWERLAAEP